MSDALIGGIMSRLNSVICLTAIMLPLALGGCAGVAIVGGLAAAGAGGYAAAQERGVTGAVSDLQIEAEMAGAFADADPGLKESIVTTVYEGRVMLTGRVATPEMKGHAAQAASRVAGVKALYDEIEVAPPRGTLEVAKDAWITARLRSELMFDNDIRSANYTIDTEDGSVYLIGSARSQRELDRTLQVARYIPGVKRVTSFVELRTGTPVAVQPSSQPGAGS